MQLELLLNSMVEAVKSLQTSIESLRAQQDADHQVVSTLHDSIVECYLNDMDQEAFGSFSERHASKFEPYLADIKILEGKDDYDPTREIFDSIKTAKSAEDYAGQYDSEEDESAYVDGIVSDVVSKLKALKGEVEEAVADGELDQAVEAAVTEAINAADETLEPKEEEWSEEIEEDPDDPLMDDWFED